MRMDRPGPYLGFGRWAKDPKRFALMYTAAIIRTLMAPKHSLSHLEFEKPVKRIQDHPGKCIAAATRMLEEENLFGSEFAEIDPNQCLVSNSTLHSCSVYGLQILFLHCRTCLNLAVKHLFDTNSARL